jgi:hypothetical protein
MSESRIVDHTEGICLKFHKQLHSLHSDQLGNESSGCSTSSQLFAMFGLFLIIFFGGECGTHSLAPARQATLPLSYIPALTGLFVVVVVVVCFGGRVLCQLSHAPSPSWFSYFSGRILSS